MRELCVATATATATAREEEERTQDEPREAAAPPTPPRPPPLAEGVGIGELVAGKIASGTFFWSVELIPGTTPQLQSSLEQSLRQLACHPPAFASVTWHVEHLKRVTSGGVAVLEHPALELCKLLQGSYRIPALLHLAAGKMKRADVRSILEACLASGITNILALRGDDKTDADSDFQHASQLVCFIKETFGSKFTIGVAGYPAGHPDTESMAENLLHLKEKIDAGASFVMTQMVTSLEEFHIFTKKCHELGMRTPIIPGLLLIQSHSGLEKVMRVCKVEVPVKILKDLQELNNEMLEIEYGKSHFKNLVQELLTYSFCPGVHIFTMNRVFAVVKILSEIGLSQKQLVQDTS